VRISGAQIIVECLKEQGVDTVFGYPGGTILPLYDALRDSPVRHILTAHEQGAAHAADGYARASGRVGVCIATSGPGATNLVTGLAAAFMDSVPVVAITGQVPTALIGRDAFQEVDITGITMPITKHNFLVKDTAKLAETIRYAFRIACSGRPGPVLVDVPRDIQAASVLFEQAPEPAEKVPFAVAGAAVARIEAAAAAIATAKRPAIIVGGGAVASETGPEIVALAEKIACPVVSTLMGLGAFPASHPLFLGLTGMHGHKPANNCIHDADLIIAVGSRFSDRVTGDRAKYAAGKTVIHIDVDPAEIDKNVAARIGITGDMKTILAMLNSRLAAGENPAWWRTIAAWKDENLPPPNGDNLTAPWLCGEIAAQAAGGDYIFATDVGQHQMWAAQHLKIETPRTWLTSGGLGAMGYGLPAAIGAQFAAPGKRVIHIAGDGGFKMTGAELHTVAAHHLPIISVVVDNGGLGMIRQLQHAFYDQRYTACELPGVDFVAFAAAFGISAVTVDTPALFSAAFSAALTSRDPKVIVAAIPPADRVTPMVPPGAAINAYLDI
jgi:acetolactate synthase-1/2/3 large subunit